MAETQSGEKKSFKMLMIIGGALLLLLAGGAGGYFFFMHQASQEAHQTEPNNKKGHDAKADEAKHEEHAEEAKHEEVAEPDIYFEMPAPFLVNFPPGSSAKVIKINIVLLMKGESSLTMLKKHEPMIRNNLLMAISTIGADKAKTREGKEELKNLMLSEIGKALEKMAGKNTAKDLYFTEFVMQ
ncbi:MAG: hypothetical protein RL563_2106 [Pseudomonadota bacterium]